MCTDCGTECEITQPEIDAYDAMIERELIGCMYLFDSLPDAVKTPTLRDEFSQMTIEECKSYVHQVNLQFGIPKQVQP